MSGRAEALLDPERLVAAVPGHGIVASRIDADNVTLSCAKSVEHDARALVLLLPGLLRVDARPFSDSIALLMRWLAPDIVRAMRGPSGQPGWREGDEAPPSDDLHRMRLYVELPEIALLVDTHLRSHHHGATRVTHISARTLVTRIDPAQMAPVEPEK